MTEPKRQAPLLTLESGIALAETNSNIKGGGGGDRVRDFGGEDADISSQSSSSGIVVRSGGMGPLLTSNEGKVNDASQLWYHAIYLEH